DVWRFKGNEKSKEIDIKPLIDRGFKRLKREGYGDVTQSLMVMGMTPEHVCILTRDYEDININGQPRLVFRRDQNTYEGAQETFTGRAKMFGPISEDDVQHYYEWMQKETAGF